jgi:hypothetical protein
VNTSTLHRIPALALAVLLPVLSPAAPDDPDRSRGPGLGWLLEPSDARNPAIEALPGVDGRGTARLVASWETVERRDGAYDWSGIEPDVDRLSGAGIEVTLCLTGGNRLHLAESELPSPYVEGAMEAWDRFVRDAVRTFAGRVRIVEIWDGPLRGLEDGHPAFQPWDYAFLLKSSSLAVRAEARSQGVEILVAQGALDVSAPDPGEVLRWQREVWAEDEAAYIDVLPVRIEAGAEGELPLARLQRAQARSFLVDLQREAVTHPPAPEIRVYVEAGAADAPAEAAFRKVAGLAIEALDVSAGTALLRLRGTRDEREQQARWIAGVQGLLATGYAGAPRNAVTFHDDEGRSVAGAVLLGQYFSEETFTTLMVYDASSAYGTRSEIHMRIPSAFVRDVRTVDPVTGTVRRTAARAVAGDRLSRSVLVPVGAFPMVLIFQAGAATPGFEVAPEELEVQRTRELTAEEIIARYREGQKLQDDRLERWMAETRMDFHFKLAQAGSSLDVTVDSTYFWERGGFLEREQRAYRVNGNRIGWKKIPRLPLIEPEKVVTLPLDLTLDKTYAYRKVGEEKVRDRPAYVLAFDPVERVADQSLYSGRIWIDKETFVRLKQSLVQTNLDAPVLTNEETDWYRDVEGPDGKTYRMLDRIDGQQIWTAGGRNLVVRRRMEFVSYRINPDAQAFADRKTEAYDSDNLVLRDTEVGFRYLEKGKDGSRTVKWDVDSDQIFLAFGAFFDNSQPNVAPLAGVNYFNYDLFGKGIQTNVLFAGVLLFATFADPDIGGTGNDLSVDVAATALKFTDRVFLGENELVVSQLRTRPQRINLRFGLPFAKFFKLNLIGSLGYVAYFDSDEAVEARAAVGGLGYVLPSDHTSLAGTAEFQFNRRGYTVTAAATTARRSDWDPWGLTDASTGEFIASEYDPSQQSFYRWGVTAFKEWYLPKFQKLRAEANYLDGDNLDRFSRYEFSFFGDDRLNGFSGAGVKFDQGAVVRAGYTFNVFEAIQFSASLETARVRKDDDPTGTQAFSGLGLSGNLVGPWRTVISLSYGYGLQSDIPEIEGQHEFLLFVFKLF